MSPSSTPAPRPYVLANCAVSADGKLAYAGGARARLSGPEDLKRVQRLRTECQAILVGAGTIRLDDPSLRVHWELLGEAAGREPLRVVLEGREPIGARARVLDGSRPTLIAGPAGPVRPYPATVDQFRAGTDRVDLPALLRELGSRGVHRLLVEGGSRVLASFLAEGLVDELSLFVAPVLIGDTAAPSMLTGLATRTETDALGLSLLSSERIDGGALLRFRPAPPPAGRRAAL
ncbi:MAG TPA: RibD family protein [Thermoplasmata archaeon]|nr:RibD family protein [Thermoplasmata archaeon]